jgi:hypothetical protein
MVCDTNAFGSESSHFRLRSTKGGIKGGIACLLSVLRLVTDTNFAAVCKEFMTLDDVCHLECWNEKCLWDGDAVGPGWEIGGRDTISFCAPRTGCIRSKSSRH